MTEPNMNYATFFSGAGIGCYGFQRNGFDCVLTNEYLTERVEIQKINQKCITNESYIQGDIREKEIRKKIETILSTYKQSDSLDVLIASPPCQGISLANHKKTQTEIVRNSLILESILLTKKFTPKYFIYENVLKFLTSVCSDSDGYDREVSDVIDRHLGKMYSIEKYVFNLKHFSIPSSRTRTVVIGVRKDIDIHPMSLYPTPEKLITLREAIFNLPRLNEPEEVQPKDVLHFFRPYEIRMRAWIENLEEGQGAFDQKDIARIPHTIIDGITVRNQSKNGDKYKRQKWDEIGPCIHTRSDTFSSQNTIHPTDDRVFSIRELMILMSIPKSFRWWPKAEKVDSYEQLKKYELVIRRAIGESIPTRFLELIGSSIKKGSPIPKEEVEELKNFFMKTTGQGAYIIKLEQETENSKILASDLKKIIFYNRLQKTNGKKIRIFIGAKYPNSPYDYAFVTRPFTSKETIMRGYGHWLYQVEDRGNLSLF